MGITIRSHPRIAPTLPGQGQAQVQASLVDKSVLPVNTPGTCGESQPLLPPPNPPLCLVTQPSSNTIETIIIDEENVMDNSSDEEEEDEESDEEDDGDYEILFDGGYMGFALFRARIATVCGASAFADIPLPFIPMKELIIKAAHQMAAIIGKENMDVLGPLLGGLFPFFSLCDSGGSTWTADDCRKVLPLLKHCLMEYRISFLALDKKVSRYRGEEEFEDQLQQFVGGLVYCTKQNVGAIVE